MIIKDVIIPVMYSILSWPYGCSLSAFLLAILNPNKLTIELPKSVILFNASEIIEIEFVKIPIISLETNNIVLKQMPKNDASNPCFFLTSSFEIFL